MTPLSLGLIMSGWVLVWTGIKGDGYGGHNPLNVIRDALTGSRTGTATASGVSIGTVSNTTGGGLILHPGNDPQGHGDHLHFEHPNAAVVVAAGIYCRGRGFAVSENPVFGGVTGNCQCDPHCGQAHCENRAIDVNWRGPGDERSKLIQLAEDLAQQVDLGSGASVAAA